MLWLLQIFTALSLSNAAPFCPPSVTTISGHRNLLQKVAVYDGIKPEGATEFASSNNTTPAERKKRYEASNIFACENAWGNGQIVGNRRTIVTVLHTLYVNGDCDKPRPLKKCTFIYQGGKRDKLFAVAKVMASGGCKPGSKLQGKDDWVILSLAGEVPAEVKPYDIPAKGGELKAGDRVLTVGKTSGLNPLNLTGDLPLLPKAHANCVAMGKDTFKHEGLMQTNCPSDYGCSGCALLTPGAEPRLLAINLGIITTKNNCVPDDGTSDSGPSQMNCRASLMVPVEGAFYDALRSVR